MGIWAATISSNDTYADTYSEFFDLYNSGLEVAEISDKLVAKNQDTINNPEDCNNFWFALAKAQWECKQLDDELYSKVSSIINDDIDIAVWRDLGVTEKELKIRKFFLDKFLTEISKERPKAKLRKKPKIQEPAFAKGDCIIFKLDNENYGGAVILEAIYNTQHGWNLVATTRINQAMKPSIKDFIKTNVLIRNFGAYDDKAAINWILPIRFKNIAHLFEKVGSVDIEFTYSTKDITYGFAGDYDKWIIEQANMQFRFEAEGNKPNLTMTLKSFIQKSKWKLW
ncbi:hypothetical protein BEL04_16065 [Mucilaginibacter sp. PPCGB 2223]|uniref:hypothetical protein n=1 Tax=Mucilaginibacter sp. PPCGB 2223 TaxID=1886027 RepID=UPI00082663E0|nr:hypothetical protein [Mucilaginibacter sp. PPCGB 2223]OCX51539.1 hypothetical protein BEL04_16065 [Mucilaginibacter sp. PPCGB 2223]